MSYYRSHPYSKQRLEQLKKYKSKFSLLYKNDETINVNNNEITLDYIKNKIKSYESDPFEILNKKKGNNFFNNYSQVIAYQKTGEYELAIKNLRKLQNSLVNYPFYDELLGDIYFSMGKYEKSIKKYKKALEILEDRYIYANNLIKCSLVKSFIQSNKNKHIKESICVLEKIIQNKPKWKILWTLLAEPSS